MKLIFDIGATSARFARADTPEQVHTYTTPSQWQELSALLEQVKKEVTLDEAVEACIGGIPGQAKDGILKGMEHLPDWREKSLGLLLTETLSSANVQIFNDTILGGIAEAREGAGSGVTCVAYIAAGSGIGGSYLINGIPVQTSYGFEPGHHILSVESLTSWEDAASGLHIQSEKHQLPTTIADEQFWEKTGTQFGAGLFNVVSFWSPEVIIISGTIGLHTPSIFLAAAERTLTSLCSKHFRPTPAIKKARFGDSANLHGALLVAQNL